MKMWENILIDHRARKADEKRKADKRRQSAGGGKNYTHNIKG